MYTSFHAASVAMQFPKVDHISHSDLLPHIRKQVIASAKSTRRLVDGRATMCRRGRGS